MRTRSFRAHDLMLVAPAPSDQSPLAIGEMVRLNSGGPSLMVVDTEGASVTVAANGGAEEHLLPRVCVQRCN